METPHIFFYHKSLRKFQQLNGMNDIRTHRYRTHKHSFLLYLRWICMVTNYQVYRNNSVFLFLWSDLKNIHLASNSNTKWLVLITIIQHKMMQEIDNKMCLNWKVHVIWMLYYVLQDMQISLHHEFLNYKFNISSNEQFEFSLYCFLWRKSRNNCKHN